MRTLVVLISLSLVTLPGCGGDDGASDVDAMPSVDAPMTFDAAVDATPDAMPVCAGILTFTGEYVDWDSTPEMFRGVFDAQFVEVGNPENVENTAPNGRAVMCLPAGVDSLVNITQPDYLPVHYTATADTTAAGSFFLRGLALSRVDSFFAEIQRTHDPAAAQVLIAVNQADQPALGAQVDLVGANNEGGFTNRGDGTYEAGTTLASDRFVLFANVDPAAGMAGVNLTPPAGLTCVGPREVAVLAGQIAAANFFCAP